MYSKTQVLPNKFSKRLFCYVTYTNILLDSIKYGPMGLLHDGTKICPVASILTRRTRCKLDLKLFLVKCSYVHVLVKLSAQTAMAMPTAECYYVFIPQNVLINTKPLSLVTFLNLIVSYICRTLSLYLLSLELYVGFYVQITKTYQLFRSGPISTKLYTSM